MIPDDVIAQIRDAADIVSVIGQHVQLKKAGTSWKGLCPFHGEKTPSFNVIPVKRFFHCFGCQKHGDVFSFLMELEGKSFVEVAEELAARFNIVVPRVDESPELRRARGERVAMLNLNKLATEFFREILADPKRGEPGRAYLQRRGVSNEIADRFQLGYAPGEWGVLADYLKAKHADLELAVKLGLIAHRPRTSGYYDRNRDRLVCPVVLPGGEVAGFSSRLVAPPQKAPDGSEPPKYINSPESPVYKKSKLLFGLAQAREAMHTQKRAVIVEGNFDVITLHQAGFTEVVAPLGTALTIEQVNLLKRLTEKIVLLYDGDRAGYKATMHALQLCVETDTEVAVAHRPGNARSGGAGTLSGGVDPDSLVASGGAEQLREAVDRALGGMDFFAFEVWGKAKANNSDAQARALQDAAQLFAKIANPVKRDLIVGTLATAMDVDVGVVRSALTRGSSGSGHHPGAGQGPGARRDQGQWGSQNGQRGQYAGQGQRSGGQAHGPRGQHPNSSTPQREDAADATRGPVAPPPMEELELISLLADHPVLIATAEADRAFWLLTDERLRAMYSAARAGQSLLELAPVQLSPTTAKHVLSGKYASKDPSVALTAMAANLEGRKLQTERQELLRGLADARRRGDHAQVRELMERVELSSRLLDATARGDRALMSQLAEERKARYTSESAPMAATDTSNRKQVE